MSKELECLDRIDKRNYLTEREHKEFLGVVENALQRLESIDNANPSEALKELNAIENNMLYLNDSSYDQDSIINNISASINTIKQYLIKQQEQEKEKLLFKNIHNTKVKTPLVAIFNGLSQDERFKFIEHIYYHWEEMKEVLEDKNSKLEKENVELKAKAQKEHKALEIIKEHIKFNDRGIETYTDDSKNLVTKFLIMLESKDTGATFHIHLDTKEEFNLLKEVLK